MSAGRPLLIVNPSSGKLGGPRSLARFTAAVEARPGRRRLRGDRSGAATPSTSPDAGPDEGRETIVAVGGDGTLNEVVNGVMGRGPGVPAGAGPRVGLIGLGTGGDFGHSLGIGRGLNDYLGADRGWPHAAGRPAARGLSAATTGGRSSATWSTCCRPDPEGSSTATSRRSPACWAAACRTAWRRPGRCWPARAPVCGCACRASPLVGRPASPLVRGRRGRHRRRRRWPRRARGLDLPARAVQRGRLWRRHAPGARRRARRRRCSTSCRSPATRSGRWPVTCPRSTAAATWACRGSRLQRCRAVESSCSTRRRPRALRSTSTASRSAGCPLKAELIPGALTMLAPARGRERDGAPTREHGLWRTPP